MGFEIKSKKHGVLSPSGAHRWMKCPASTILIQQFNPVSKFNFYTAEGTVAHEVHELCLTQNKTAHDYVGQKFKAEGVWFTVNVAMADAVQTSIDWIRNRVDYLSNTKKMQVELHAEVQCSLEHLNVEGLSGGTADVVLVALSDNPDVKSVIDVIDYKHGAGVPVEADNNVQAMQYALGAMQAMIEMGKVDSFYDFEVNIVISQPRSFHELGLIRSWRTTGMELERWQNMELIPAANRVWEPNPEYVPSEGACKFCPVAGKCTALFNKTQELAQVDFDAIEPTTEELPVPNIDSLTMEQKAKVMKYAPAIQQFLNDVCVSVEDDMRAGKTEGYDEFKLIRRVTHTRLTEVGSCPLESPLLDLFDYEEVTKSKFLPISELKLKIYAKLGKEEGDKFLKSITFKPEGDIIAVHRSKRGKEITVNPVDDFKSIK